MPLLAQPKVIVWDLDDTLWDCLKHYRYFINPMREKFQLQLWTDVEFDNFGYKNREHIFKHMFEEKADIALDYFNAIKPHGVVHHLHGIQDSLLDNKLVKIKVPTIKIGYQENGLFGQ